MNDADASAAQDPSTSGQRFQINRVVAFLGPYIAIVSGALATWLVRHFPGLHVDQATLGSTITQGVVFIIGAAVTYGLQHKWLDGWQKYEGQVANVAAGDLPDTPPEGAYDQSTFVPASAIGADTGLEAHAVPSLTAGSGGEVGGPYLAQTTTVLPSDEQEQVSTPEIVDGDAVPGRPESATKPDEPIEELEPVEY